MERSTQAKVYDEIEDQMLKPLWRRRWAVRDLYSGLSIEYSSYSDIPELMHRPIKLATMFKHDAKNGKWKM